MSGDAPVSDETLVGLAAGGDDRAYELLVRRHAGRLLAVSRRLLAREDDARRVVTDAFVHAVGSLPAREASVSLATWLRRHLVQTALDALDRGAAPRV